MVFEDGENWQPREPEMRGRHGTTRAAFEAALKDLLTERNEFFDSLPDMWAKLFPDLPAKPGRYEDGRIVLYVRSAPLLYLVHPKLRAIAAKLRTLPNAPKTIEVRVEIHAT